jgi:hypothetical protein
VESRSAKRTAPSVELEAPSLSLGGHEDMAELRLDWILFRDQEEQLIATDDALPIALNFSANLGRRSPG